MADQGDIGVSISTSCGPFKGARDHGSASLTRRRWRLERSACGDSERSVSAYLFC